MYWNSSNLPRLKKAGMSNMTFKTMIGFSTSEESEENDLKCAQTNSYWLFTTTKLRRSTHCLRRHFEPSSETLLKYSFCSPILVACVFLFSRNRRSSIGQRNEDPEEVFRKRPASLLWFLEHSYEAVFK